MDKLHILSKEIFSDCENIKIRNLKIIRTRFAKVLKFAANAKYFVRHQNILMHLFLYLLLDLIYLRDNCVFIGFSIQTLLFSLSIFIGYFSVYYQIALLTLMKMRVGFDRFFWIIKFPFMYVAKIPETRPHLSHLNGDLNASKI